MLFVQLFDPVADNPVVAEFGIVRVDGSKANAANAFVTRRLRPGLAFVFQIVVPLRFAVEASVVNFAGTQREAAGFFESGDEALFWRDNGAPVVGVAVNTRARRPSTRKEAGAGSVANGGRGMAVGKADAARRKPVDVWRFGLLVAARVADPMVQIIRDDEENIRPFRLFGETMKRQGQ